MMKSFVSKMMAAALVAVPFLATPAAADDMRAPVASEWRNPSNSVQVRIDRCGGAKLCGTITWASPKAIADARRGGTEQLVGTRLFRDLAPAGKGKWKCKVLVPDIRQTFAGTLEFADSNTMVGKGCVLFGIICKSQSWSRVR